MYKQSYHLDRTIEIQNQDTIRLKNHSGYELAVEHLLQGVKGRRKKLRLQYREKKEKKEIDEEKALE